METFIVVTLLIIIAFATIASGYYAMRNVNSYREMSRMAEDVWRRDRRGL